MSKILIDIGCFNAKTNSITYKLLKKKREKWFGYMIEPNPHMKEDIIKNLEGLDYQYFNFAISNKNGISPFYLGKYGFFNRREKVQKNKCMRSSLVTKDYVKQHLSDTHISIETKTLKQFIKDNNISHIDLLKIDTEGHDYDILKEYFKNTDNIVMPLKIITEDLVKNKEEEYNEQNIIKEKKKKLLLKLGYIYNQLDFYNSEFTLANQVI